MCIAIYLKTHHSVNLFVQVFGAGRGAPSATWRLARAARPGDSSPLSYAMKEDDRAVQKTGQR